MSISKQQIEKATAQFIEGIKNVDESDIEYAWKKGKKAIDKYGNNPPGALAKIWRDIKLMIGLITDYAQGNYKDVSWKVMAAVTGAVVYFVSPIDVIPDFLPIMCYLDDALVIKLALDMSGDDLSAYERWKKA